MKKYIKAQCANCGTEYTLNANFADGARCNKCQGEPLVLLGYTDIPIQRKLSIDLEAEDYCYGCEDFTPGCNRVISYRDEKTVVTDTVVSCTSLERCRRIAERIKAPRSKKSAF